MTKIHTRLKSERPRVWEIRGCSAWKVTRGSYPQIIFSCKPVTELTGSYLFMRVGGFKDKCVSIKRAPILSEIVYCFILSLRIKYSCGLLEASTFIYLNSHTFQLSSNNQPRNMHVPSLFSLTTLLAAASAVTGPFLFPLT